MSGVVLGIDNIIVNGKVIETRKSIGQTSKEGSKPTLIYSNSIIAHYKFDLPNGLLDSSPSGLYNLTSLNPLFDTTKSITGTSSAFENGISDSSLRFPKNLTDRFYNIGNTTGISFSLWYNIDISASGEWGSLFEFNETFIDFADNKRIGISRHGGSNGLWLGIKIGTNIWAQAYTIGSGTLDNSWHHIVWCINPSGVWTIYLDGILQSGYTTINLPQIVINTTYDFSYIFDSTLTNHIKGNVDNFMIHSSVLSLSEVNILHKKYDMIKKPETIIIDDDYEYISFPNTGYDQTSYSINFPEETECSILVVGGGGAGGKFGGGGGGGSVLFRSQILLNGSQSIIVGRGGIGNSSMDVNGENGKQSMIVINGVNYIGDGGGGGGTRQGPNTYHGRSGNNGGSGGGGSTAVASSTVFIGGITSRLSYSYSGWETNGFNGGAGRPSNQGTGNKYLSGGGGGAGGVGNNWDTYPNRCFGGFGKDYISVFGNNIGDNGYFGGGGGGHTYIEVPEPENMYFCYGNGGDNLFGGGGIGGYDGLSTNFNIPGGDGINGTGGGGGGGIWNGGVTDDILSGDGGSGIVIIKYKKIRINHDAEWKYSSSNPNVYYLGNVGIGNTKPTTSLQVLGSIVIEGAISAGSKTFRIEHPLNINKWLYHGCVEGPRFDNIYRGKKIIINGKGYVDIDDECNTTGGMTKGTFVALNINCQLYIMNNQTYDRVNGKIIDGRIIINCSNKKDNIEIDWLVICERQDNEVINVPITTISGSLICEHEKEK
jgi:hypothetical protein